MTFVFNIIFFLFSFFLWILFHKMQKEIFMDTYWKFHWILFSTISSALNFRQKFTQTFAWFSFYFINFNFSVQFHFIMFCEIHMIFIDCRILFRFFVGNEKQLEIQEWQSIVFFLIERNWTRKLKFIHSKKALRTLAIQSGIWAGPNSHLHKTFIGTNQTLFFF